MTKMSLVTSQAIGSQSGDILYHPYISGGMIRHRDEFIATEGQKVFNLEHTYDPHQNKIDVVVGGVSQFSPDNFYETSSTSFTLSEGLPVGTEVTATYFEKAQPLESDLESVVNTHTLLIAQIQEELPDDLMSLDNATLDKSLEGGTSDKDNYAKLFALVTKAKSNNQGLYIPNGSYYCSENLVIQGIRNIIIDGEIVMAPGKMLEIVYDSVSTDACNWNINTVIGKIRISGVKNGIIKLNDATELELYANGDDSLRKAIAYSQFHLGNIETLNMFSEGVEGGWINENAFWGGRIDFINIDGNYPHNNNTFYKLMIEGSTVNIENGNSNRFYDCRFEGTNILNFGAKTFGNVFERTWESGKGYYLRTAIDSSNTTVTDLGVGNTVVFADDLVTDKQVIYKVNYNSNNFPVNLILKNQYNLQNKETWSTFFETGLIKLTGDIGIHLLTDTAIFRPRIYFYDEFKQLITTSLTLDEHVSYYGGTTWGPAYDTDLFSLKYGNNITDFGVSIFKSIPAKYIKIGIAFGGTIGTFENLELSVRTMNRRTINTTLNSRFQRYSNPTAPTDGYWRVGDIVYHSAPSIGQPLGWVCTTEGSPGTWNSFDRHSRIESLSADPIAPVIGQIWLRSDL